MLDFNDAPEQRTGEPFAPCYAKLKGTIRPGGINGFGPGDEGLLKASNSSDALMLDFEFTVMHGPNAGRKVFSNMVVSGGAVNEKGESKGWNMTKSTLRAMVESAMGIPPADMSDAARAKRMFQCFRQLDGIEFAAKIDIEKGGDKPGGGKYDDKNVIKTVVTPNKPEWQPIMAGQDVPLAPAAAAGQKPAGGTPWASGGAPAGNAAAPRQPAQTSQPGAAPAWTPGQPPAQGGQQAGGAKPGPAWLNG